MKYKHAFGLAIVMLFVLQTIAIFGEYGTNQIPISNEVVDTVTTPLNLPPVEYEKAGAYEEDPILINHAPNPSFEYVNDLNIPTHWYSDGSGYTVTNSSYQDNVHSGSRAGQLIAEGTSSFGAYASFGRSYGLTCYLTSDLTFESYYYINSLSNPDIGGHFYIGHSIYTGSQWRNIYYFLFYPSSYHPSNSTNTLIFLLDTTTSTWNNLTRNITDDYESYYGAAPGSAYVSYTNWIIYSPVNADVPISIIIDDNSVTDAGSTEYVFDGGFELGGVSWGSYKTSPSTIHSSLDSTDGLLSANISINAVDENSDGYAYLQRYFGYPQGLYAERPDSMYLEFDWKYDDSWNGAGQMAYAYLFMQNNTYTKEVAILLGSDLDSYSVSNSSYSSWIISESHGSRGVWHHESIDVAELWQVFNIADMTITHVSFYCNIGSHSNSSITLLVDNVKILTYPTADPGFEVDFYWSSAYPVGSWSSYYNAYPYVNHTTDSLNGRYAANFTTWGGSSIIAGLSRETNLQVGLGLFTDMWWRLDTMGSESQCYVEIMMAINDWTYELHYVLAGGSSFFNSSNIVYYIVENHSETGQWFNLVRNIYADLTEAFGESEWKIHYIYLAAKNGPGETVSVLFDDVHFIQDTHAPTLTQILTFPTNPMYYESVLVNIEATDITGVSGSLWYYNGVSWNAVSLTSMGGHFEALIPPIPYGTDVLYYFNLTDPVGNWAIYDNSGLYYSYVIDDDIDPIVTITSPRDEDIIVGLITLSASAYDPDSGSSGVHHLEIWVNGEYSGSFTGDHFEFTSDSREVENGTYYIEVRAYDNAGNWASDEIVIYIENDRQAPILSMIDINPQQPISGEDVTISLAVTDQTGVKNVTLYYRVPLGIWHELVMDSSGSLYFATIPAQIGTDLVEFYIVAYDVFDQQSTGGTSSSPLSFEIITEIGEPVISSVQLTPAVPVYDQTVSVSAYVTAETTIQSVVLHYKIGEGSWTSIAMILSDNLYIGSIPAASWNTEVNYYIVVIDNADQSVSYGTILSPKSYIVGDMIAPILTVIGPSTLIPIRGNVSFYVSGVDVGSGISIIEMIVNGTTIRSSTVLPTFLVWDTTSLSNGNYTITFILEDNAGNIALISYEYMIANPDIFGSIGEGLSSFMQTYGLFVGALAFMILLVAAKIIVRRRG
ncbi:hypothetical protein EU527_12885 [Candidatus Thorarchaeota archaeon]|nr:MAG: hypothetical protein EU527_12885 [Candidatus Thorarchaeota archaeon]